MTGTHPLHWRRGRRGGDDPGQRWRADLPDLCQPFKPKGKSWESVPVRVQPKLTETAGAGGPDPLQGCDYALEVRGLAAGGKTVRGEVCLRVRG